jgi:hypothetical protein
VKLKNGDGQTLTVGGDLSLTGRLEVLDNSTLSVGKQITLNETWNPDDYYYQVKFGPHATLECIGGAFTWQNGENTTILNVTGVEITDELCEDAPWRCFALCPTPAPTHSSVA